MLVLYDYRPSGNGYKVRLLLQLLNIPYGYVDLDIETGETRTAEFLEKNPNGKIPVLKLESGEYLSESNAILCYLSEGTPYWPADALLRARVLQWLFFEQYSHEPNIATVRYWKTHGFEMTPIRLELIAQKTEAGHAALGVMEKRLANADYLVGDTPTIADICLYGYTHIAHEGDFDLTSYPGVNAWLERLGGLPDIRPITEP